MVLYFIGVYIINTVKPVLSGHPRGKLYCPLNTGCPPNTGFNRYRIFSIKRPRRLFKTWPQGPGVYLKPAFNRGPAFINEVKFSSFLG